MNPEQLRDQRFDRTLDEITRRELKIFRQESIERRKAEQKEAEQKAEAQDTSRK